MGYMAFKWLHFVALISWMAGILYLIRLFVNHRERSPTQETHDLLVGMELRIYRYITTPAMIATFVGGLGMIAVNPAIMKGAGWLHTKILFVVLLAGFTGYAGGLRRKFMDRSRIESLPSGKTLRILNELPTVLMMIVIGLAVFRPF